ncbi:hypothetical protein OA190_01520 [Prochlorococcus sp. AH-736-A13]|nr:hypothetical protein [Prochlorococcus sp. AH-736-A13]
MNFKLIFIFTILLTNSLFIPLSQAGWQKNLAKLKKPLTRIFAPLIMGKGAYEMKKGKSDEFCMKNGSYYKCNN